MCGSAISHLSQSCVLLLLGSLSVVFAVRTARVHYYLSGCGGGDFHSPCVRLLFFYEKTAAAAENLAKRPHALSAPVILRIYTHVDAGHGKFNRWLIHVLLLVAGFDRGGGMDGWSPSVAPQLYPCIKCVGNFCT